MKIWYEPGLNYGFVIKLNCKLKLSAVTGDLAYSLPDLIMAQDSMMANIKLEMEEEVSGSLVSKSQAEQAPDSSTNHSQPDQSNQVSSGKEDMILPDQNPPEAVSADRGE